MSAIVRTPSASGDGYIFPVLVDDDDDDVEEAVAPQRHWLLFDTGAGCITCPEEHVNGIDPAVGRNFYAGLSLAF